MKDLYKEKLDVNYYDWPRGEVISLLESNKPQEPLENVLEIGCGSGNTASLLKEKLDIRNYFGIELNAEAAEKAGKIMTMAYALDIENLIRKNEQHEILNHQYDLVLVLDVLEHLQDPWLVLKTINKWLTPGGKIIASIPNSGNWYVVKKLLNNRFEYEDRGLLDKTHLRFFTLHTIENMFAQAGLKITALTDTNDLFIPKIRFFNTITFGLFRKQFIRQYILIAEPING